MHIEEPGFSLCLITGLGIILISLLIPIDFLILYKFDSIFFDLNIVTVHTYGCIASICHVPFVLSFGQRIVTNSPSTCRRNPISSPRCLPTATPDTSYSAANFDDYLAAALVKLESSSGSDSDSTAWSRKQRRTV